MELKKLHMGTLVFGFDSMDEVATIVASTLVEETTGRRQNSLMAGGAFPARNRRDMNGRVRDAVLALATCHNVGPYVDQSQSVFTSLADSAGDASAQ
jgi:phospholipid-translocating ATPase